MFTFSENHRSKYRLEEIKTFKYFDKICDVLHLIPVFKFYSLQTHVSIIKAENKNRRCGDYKVFSQ